MLHALIPRITPRWPSGKASASKAAGLGLIPAFVVDPFPGRVIPDFKVSTAVATPPGAWRYSVSAGTGWPGVSIFWLGDTASLTCKLCLSVAARTIVLADLSMSYTSMLLGRTATKQQQYLVCEAR